MKTLRFTIGVLLGIALPLAVQWLDRRYLLTPPQRARTWNTASWAAALYAFGPLSMIGWLWVTRSEPCRWWREDPPLALAKSLGLLLAGVLAAAFVLAPIVLISDD
jgi:hypothetical protein